MGLPAEPVRPSALMAAAAAAAGEAPEDEDRVGRILAWHIAKSMHDISNASSIES